MKDKFVKPWTDLYNEQMKVRLEKRDKLNELSNSYKNGFTPNAKSIDLTREYGHLEKEEIGETPIFALAGRAMLVRGFGKASFIQLDDGHGRFQVYLRKGDIGDDDFAESKLLDYGDIIFAEGKLFKTNKGELTLACEKFKILTKSIRPLPEKFHGLTDPELRYRMRYVDLAMNPEVREKLRKRSQIVRHIREFFYNRDYLEVETPMMHSVAGGATAKPFKTHHNALDMELSMRIAPELHLKRLIAGGYQRVFEMNRCFRNEGLSLKHNPEFTSIEFYQAFATYEDLMELTEELLSGLVQEVFQTTKLKFGEREIDYSRPFRRMSMRDSVVEFSPVGQDQIEDEIALRETLIAKSSEYKQADLEKLPHGKLLELCFEEFVEEKLIQPTFITDYPTVISPLSRRNDERPEIVDRFEFFINGWEIANAFSELNNPADQLDRFADQAIAKEEGDDEACDVDYDYVRSLEYGMAPTAGEGIGIDRLTMLLTDSHTIREVIFFPLLKKEAFFNEESEQKE
jgi:lysyl-tRNA synthetase class 2